MAVRPERQSTAPGPPIGPWSTLERALIALRSVRVRMDARHGGRIALERYDLVIIGGGAAGINALKAAATLAARVALVDRGPLGGTCVNRG